MRIKFDKNVFRKYLLMIACLVLFFAGGFRAFNLYKNYKSYNQEIAIIEKNSDNTIHTILKAILIEGYEMTENNTILKSGKLALFYALTTGLLAWVAGCVLVFAWVGLTGVPPISVSPSCSGWWYLP